MKKIAVLLPVYKNDSPVFFKQALDSVINQTLQDFVILIGVDGPIEGDLEKLLKDLHGNERIKICYFKENRGLACVLNDLISEGRKYGCEYLARMDADDLCVPERFQLQIDFLQSHPEVDIVGGAIEEIDGDGVKNGKKITYPMTHEECRAFFRFRDPVAHPATFFRISFFDKAKGYRPEYRKNQDTMMWLDGFMSGAIFANVPDTVLLFRVAKDFYNRRSGWKRARQMLKSRMEINKAMKYDLSANLFAIAMAGMTIAPKFIKKILYSIR